MSNAAETLEPTDAVLVARFCNDDAAAFDMLVQRHSNRAYQIAYGVLGSREDAEEVVQDVFIRIHRALKNFRGDAEFSTWLYRIALNLARNKYRWNKSRGSQQNISMNAPIEGADLEDDGIAMDIPAPKMAPDQQAAFAELEANVTAQLETLKPVFREALVMRNLDDMNYEQIAEIMQCKLGTIKSRIARAREELRKRLNL